MPSWSSYSSKNSPDNTDTLMIKDNVEAGNPNKQLSFSNLWNWVLSKLRNTALPSSYFSPGTAIIPAISSMYTNTGDMRLHRSTILVGPNKTKSLSPSLSDVPNSGIIMTISRNDPNLMSMVLVSIKVDSSIVYSVIYKGSKIDYALGSAYNLTVTNLYDSSYSADYSCYVYGIGFEDGKKLFTI